MILFFQRPLMGLIFVGLLLGVSGLTLHAVADADKPAQVSHPKTVTTKLLYLRTEQDAEGPLKVYQVQPPYPGWATGGLAINHATVQIIKTGLEVSFIVGTTPEKRAKEVEDIPLDIKTMVITYDKSKVTFADGLGHHYLLEPNQITF